MDQFLLDNLRDLMRDNSLILKAQVQSLWSGYGEIVRIESQETMQTFIVKHICPPTQSNHPRGWNTDISHQRKLHSYKVESQFYQHYAPSCDEQCKVPELIFFREHDNSALLVLEDLNRVGYTQRVGSASLEQITSGIHWLAFFHARFLGASSDGLWPIGTYWHLATRPDEINTMPAGELKEAAHWIDQRLNDCAFKTLVHGDAKLANLCFNPNNQSVAAVDFQYVGGGIGLKDVVYFLGSCLNDRGLQQHADTFVDMYFKQLRCASVLYQNECDLDQLEKQWRSLYSLVWADFQRFLAGWSPGHTKLNSYMQNQTTIALRQ